MKRTDKLQYRKTIAGIRPYFHVVMVAIFYLLSGFWEGCLAATQGQYFPDFNNLLNLYRNHLLILGCTTIFIGILLLCKVNFARIAAIVLAWWNLFVGPLLHVWWYMYSGEIKNYLYNGSVSITIHDIILLSIMTFIRIYIIYILSKSRAGYIFLREYKDNK